MSMRSIKNGYSLFNLRRSRMKVFKMQHAIVAYRCKVLKSLNVISKIMDCCNCRDYIGKKGGVADFNTVENTGLGFSTNISPTELTSMAALGTVKVTQTKTNNDQDHECESVHNKHQNNIHDRNGVNKQTSELNNANDGSFQAKSSKNNADFDKESEIKTCQIDKSVLEVETNSKSGKTIRTAKKCTACNRNEERMVKLEMSVMEMNETIDVMEDFIADCTRRIALFTARRGGWNRQHFFSWRGKEF